MTKPATFAFAIRPEWNAARRIEIIVEGAVATVSRWTGSEWVRHSITREEARTAWAENPLTRERMELVDGIWLSPIDAECARTGCDPDEIEMMRDHLASLRA